MLHDEFYAHLLEIIPMLFLIIGSACARGSLRKYTNTQAKYLEIVLSPPIIILRFDLDFRPSGLRRISLHLHHPAAGFVLAAASK